jgi:hypothetical protein
VNIYSTSLNDDYVYMSGTRMATPFVAGTLALLKQASPNLLAIEIQGVFRTLSRDLGTPGRDEWFGCGLIQTPLSLIDIYGHWAYGDILEVFNSGSMRDESGLFSPKLPLSRAQATAVLVRALELQKLDQSSIPLTDIEGHWAQVDIEIISQHRIMRGVEENTFSPNTPITRQQMAVILARLLQLERTNAMNNQFIDVKEGYWATNDIIATTNHQIFRGLSYNTFGGESTVTRAQMAALMNRISQQIGQTS